MIDKIKAYKKQVIVILIAAALTGIILLILKQIPVTLFIYPKLKTAIQLIFIVWMILYIIKYHTKVEFLYKPLKYTVIITVSLFFLLLISLGAWYNYCVFPDDQEYLQKIADSVSYKGDDLHEVELDLLHKINEGMFSSPLSSNDLKFLKSKKLKQREYYIDINPYGNKHTNNLKYSTGKIFYYTYQKNSLVLKAGSSVQFDLKDINKQDRFLELDLAYPSFQSTGIKDGKLRVYFIAGERRLLFQKKIKREIKPDIKPYNSKNFFSLLSFYLKHPGRSVLRGYTGWEKANVKLPSGNGKLEIEFIADEKGKNYLFVGSPRVYKIKNKKRNDHVNIVYLIFDTFAKHHIDIYEYYNKFKKMPYDEVIKELGKQKALTPAIDRYFKDIVLFNNMQTAGQVTRPSIVAMWASQNYTKCRQPVFRNIVTEENQREFFNQGFTTLGYELSKDGYLTKQISCNAQGHGVSGVGSDLGFDENYDYTMETSELPENFRRIIEFLDENQNKKFFLYAHINVPHTPKWIPAGYYLDALFDRKFIHNTAKMVGNIRYLNDSLGKVFHALEKLKLLRNTIIVIAADHSSGRDYNFRNEVSKDDRLSWRGDSQRVADFHSRAIYLRKGSQHLLREYMNIPWVVIAPQNGKFLPGRVDSFISTLDVSPTLLDIAQNRSTSKFSGKSFKSLLFQKKDRGHVFNKFIPLVGRFQRGFIYNGRYKYWINIQGLYKYTKKGNKKYIMQQEYLYDLKKDPHEITNLASNNCKNKLLSKMRKIYFEKFTDYPDKNFIQVSPSKNNTSHKYIVKVKSFNGKIIYPKTYGEGIKVSTISNNQMEFNFSMKDKRVFLSFETLPSDAHMSVTIFQDGKKISSEKIFSSVETINCFNNPILLNNNIDFHVARVTGKNGLEEKNIPENSVYFYRIPLNYWMEMNRNTKDIQLSPGIKEVLKGWGYIQ